MFPRFLAVALSFAAASAAAADAPYGLTTKPALQGTTFPDLPPVSGAVRFDRIFSQISLDQPLYIAAPPGDDSQLYVVTKTGMVWKVPNTANPADSEKKKVLDLSTKVLTDEEQGLLGLAFDPDFATNKKIYVYYSTQLTGGQRTQLSAFTVGATPALTLASEKALLKIPQYTAIHKGGCVQVGPDKKLYLTVGDGGPQGDPDGNGQSLYTPKAKVLRLNLDGSFPADNPFVSTQYAFGGTWAYGFRNPWRCSFDRATGDLWVGDVGDIAREEIDKVRKGGNYGWTAFEGDIEYNNWQHLPASAFDQPVLAYSHDSTATPLNGHSVVGGYVYRGSALPALVGKYIFTDYIVGDVWALTISGAAAGTLTRLGNVGGPVSFGTDNAGNLYVVSVWGQIYKINPAEEGSTNFPTKLSQTGLFTDLAGLTPTTGLVEYEINAPLWSDGALKRRWVGLPAGTYIGFLPMDPWYMAKGSLLVKHFEMKMADGTTKRLETRVLINQRPGWRGYTYRWNAAGTDADLLDGGQTATLDVMDSFSSTGHRTITYEFPSRGACQFCHNNAGGPILGFRALQFNRDHKFANGVTDNQLRAWSHAGSFNYGIGDVKYFTRIKDPADTTATLAERARSYLDANCSQCHRPGGPTQIDMDLRAFTAGPQTKAIDVAPTDGDFGIPDARRIAPGSKERSVLWKRMQALDGRRMPPIGSHMVDQAAVNLIGAWIDAGAADGYDYNRIRPMYGGSFTATRNGLKDVLTWNFAQAQQCSLTLYNAVNKDGKPLGTFSGAGSYAQDNKALKNTYSLSCWNPYATDWWSITLGGT